MLIVQSFDSLVYIPENKTIREKCTECGQDKIVAEDGHAVCECTARITLWTGDEKL